VRDRAGRSVSDPLRTLALGARTAAIQPIADTARIGALIAETAPCGRFSTTSAILPNPQGSPPRADRQPWTTRRSLPYRTGRPWRNRHPSMSATRKCSGNPLPSSPPASDAPLLAPRARPTTPHAHLAPSEMATPSPRRRARGACHPRSAMIASPRRQPPDAAFVRLHFLSLTPYPLPLIPRYPPGTATRRKSCVFSATVRPRCPSMSKEKRRVAVKITDGHDVEPTQFVRLG
jgi:hypothetical protein